MGHLASCGRSCCGTHCVGGAGCGTPCIVCMWEELTVGHLHCMGGADTWGHIAWDGRS